MLNPGQKLRVLVPIAITDGLDWEPGETVEVVHVSDCSNKAFGPHSYEIADQNGETGSFCSRDIGPWFKPV